MTRTCYQVAGPGTIDFQLSGDTNACGTRLYRIREVDEGILNRKFSMLTSALMADRMVDVYRTGVCEGNREMVAWVLLRATQ